MEKEKICAAAWRKSYNQRFQATKGDPGRHRQQGWAQQHPPFHCATAAGIKSPEGAEPRAKAGAAQLGSRRRGKSFLPIDPTPLPWALPIPLPHTTSSSDPALLHSIPPLSCCLTPLLLCLHSASGNWDRFTLAYIYHQNKLD